MQEQITNIITVTIKGFEGLYAILESPGMPAFYWPIKNLPEGVTAGSTLQLKALTSKEQDAAKFEHMRRLLEELIN